jgi:HJR/Mrr/RecB family endonuclease
MLPDSRFSQKVQDTGRLIENTRNRLESAEKELSCLESDWQHATEAARQKFHQWQVDTARYERLCSLYELACRHEEASNRYHALLEIVTSRRYQLLNANWRDMRGTVFESFLQEVFEMLGYVVQTTKASGDQGIDLILIRDERRIGVQAKGYAESVGNHAVMEANAGKDYYHCHSCVVITNSDFTRLARELATEINCLLIGANEIPNLIMGNIRL